MKLVGGTTGAQVISILSAPFITRLFSPETYGILGIYIAFTSIFIMLSTGRYHMGIVIPREENEAKNLFFLSTYITITLSIITLLVIALFNGEIAKILSAPALKDILWLAPLSILFRGFYLSFQYLFIRKEKYGSIAGSQILDTSSGAMVIIASGLLISTNSMFLVLGRITGGFLSLLYLLKQINLKSNLQHFLKPKFRELASTAIQYKKFPLVSSWAIFLNTLAYSAPILLMSFYFSKELVGFYTLADRVVLTPLSIIGGATAQIFYKRISALEQSKIPLSESILFTVNKLSSICLFPLLLLGFIGQDLFAFIFGKSWAEAGLYAQLLVAYAIGRFIVAPLTNTASTIQKQELELYFNILLFILRSLAVIIGGVYNDVILMLLLLSAGSMLSYLCLLLFICNATNTPIIKCCTIIIVNLVKAIPFIIIFLLSSKVGFSLNWLAASVFSTICFLYFLLYENKALLFNLKK